MGAKLIVLPPTAFLEKKPNTIWIEIPKEENKGGNEWRVKAHIFEFAVKVFKDNTASEPANSRIIVKKLTPLDENGDMTVKETIIDGVDSVALVRDVDFFEHEYIVRIEEANVFVVGVIRYL